MRYLGMIRQSRGQRHGSHSKADLHALIPWCPHYQLAVVAMGHLRPFQKTCYDEHLE